MTSFFLSSYLSCVGCLLLFLSFDFHLEKVTFPDQKVTFLLFFHLCWNPEKLSMSQEDVQSLSSGSESEDPDFMDDEYGYFLSLFVVSVSLELD